MGARNRSTSSSSSSSSSDQNWKRSKKSHQKTKVDISPKRTSIKSDRPRDQRYSSNSARSSNSSRSSYDRRRDHDMQYRKHSTSHRDYERRERVMESRIPTVSYSKDRHNHGKRRSRSNSPKSNKKEIVVTDKHKKRKKHKHSKKSEVLEVPVQDKSMAPPVQEKSKAPPVQEKSKIPPVLEKSEEELILMKKLLERELRREDELIVAQTSVINVPNDEEDDDVLIVCDPVIDKDAEACKAVLKEEIKEKKLQSKAVLKEEIKEKKLQSKKVKENLPTGNSDLMETVHVKSEEEENITNSLQQETSFVKEEQDSPSRIKLDKTKKSTKGLDLLTKNYEEEDLKVDKDKNDHKSDSKKKSKKGKHSKEAKSSKKSKSEHHKSKTDSSIKNKPKIVEGDVKEEEKLKSLKIKEEEVVDSKKDKNKNFDELTEIKNRFARELEAQKELERRDQETRESDVISSDYSDKENGNCSVKENSLKERIKCDVLVPEDVKKENSYSDDSDLENSKSSKSNKKKDSHLIEDSSPSKSRQTKTSDTYWNKYADRLGIHIEDPKNSSNLNHRENFADKSRDDDTQHVTNNERRKSRKRSRSTDKERNDHEMEKKFRRESDRIRNKDDLEMGEIRSFVKKPARSIERDEENSKHRFNEWNSRRQNDKVFDKRRENSVNNNFSDKRRENSEERRDSMKTNAGRGQNVLPAAPLIRKPVLDPILTRTGGAYIPPAKLKMMQDQITDKNSVAFQRLAWEALKKSINGLVNKINVSNIGIIVRELLQENVIRGRGVLCRAITQAQAFSPTFTHVYAALIAVINSKFPQIGELLLNRLILNLRRGVKRNDKTICMASCRFIAHLVNQQVAHEILALEILTMLLEKAKDNTDETETGEKARNSCLELSIAMLKESGMKLEELSRKSMIIVQDSLRSILHEGKLDSRYKYMIEVIMAIIKTGFKDYPCIVTELDLVEPEDQFTHMVELDEKLEAKEILNVFKHDPEYEQNDAKYKEIKASILGGDSDNESGSDGGSGSESDESDSDEGTNEVKQDLQVIDMTETNLVSFRRKVYLTIQSSLDVDETAHKLLKGEIKPGWEKELCNMFIDCCAQQRTYMKFYGLLAQRFCMINNVYRECFIEIFKEAYETCHRFEIEKIRNVAKLFSHLLFSDALSWEVLSCIHLNQDETTSSSRVFLKILFEELANFMGLSKLNERLRDPTLSPYFEGLLPCDHPAHTRFAINFFTTIGLGGLTDDLRELLRSQPKPTAVVAPVQQASKKQTGKTKTSRTSDTGSSSSTSSSSSSSDSSSDSSSSDSSSSDSSDSDSSD